MAKQLDSRHGIEKMFYLCWVFFSLWLHAGSTITVLMLFWVIHLSMGYVVIYFIGASRTLKWLSRKLLYLQCIHNGDISFELSHPFITITLGFFFCFFFHYYFFMGYWYRNFHREDKIQVRLFNLHNGIEFTDMTWSLYWNGSMFTGEYFESRTNTYLHSRSLVKLYIHNV